MSESATIEPTDLRALNMQKRRERILAEARRTIAEKGFAGLSLRTLAAASDVTVPTIYNLIGNKDQILISLIGDMVGRVEKRLEGLRFNTPLDMAEAVIVESTHLFGADEAFYRAALVANEYLTRQDERLPAFANISERSVELPARACRMAAAQGLLRGDIAPDVIGAQIFGIYRTASRDWAFGRISIDSFRRIALMGVYLGLAADATDAFRPALLERIAALGPITNLTTNTMKQAG